MKKEYELVQWYPSLPLGWSPEHEYLFDGKTNIISNLSKLEDCFKTEHEINLIELDFPNYWKEKRKPLFVTEDGVEVLSDIDNLYAVNLTYFNKTKNTLRHSSWLIENSAYKVFYHEANADEYIAWYKKEFSINDLLLADVGITTSQLDKLQELAKERSKE